MVKKKGPENYKLNYNEVLGDLLRPPHGGTNTNQSIKLCSRTAESPLMDLSCLWKTVVLQSHSVVSADGFILL